MHAYWDYKQLHGECTDELKLVILILYSMHVCVPDRRAVRQYWCWAGGYT